MDDELKRLFAKHLAQLGYEPEAPREAILDKLRTRMGEARYAQVFSRSGSHSTSAQEEFYSHFEDIVEGNLMRSLDPGVTLDASFELYRKCAPHLVPGARVLELGCWTGGLASFIAARHPQCQVTGVDGARKVVDACAAHYRLPNLTFRRWNYRWAKPEDVEPGDVLLCSLGVVHHQPDNTQVPDPAAVRRSREYRVQRDHAVGYFSVWRRAARDGGLLFAVLRLRLFERFLGWLDAAQETGWAPLLERLWRVDLPGEGSVLPGLVFRAAACERPDEDAILDRWTWFMSGAHVYGRYAGGAALAAFQALSDRSVLGARDYRHNGAPARDEVGVTGALGYVFSHDAGSDYRLVLVSRAKAQEVAAVAAADPSSTPITERDGLRTAAAPAERVAKPAATPGPASSPFFAGAGSLADFGRCRTDDDRGT